MNQVQFEIRSIKSCEFLHLRYEIQMPGMPLKGDAQFMCEFFEFEKYLIDLDIKFNNEELKTLNWDGNGVEPKLINEFRAYLFSKLNLEYVNRATLQQELISELRSELDALIVRQKANAILNELKPMQRARGKRAKPGKQSQSKEAS